jgi:hypothetical protein
MTHSKCKFVAVFGLSVRRKRAKTPDFNVLYQKATLAHVMIDNAKVDEESFGAGVERLRMEPA